MRGPLGRQSTLTRPQAYIPDDQQAKEEHPYYGYPPRPHPDTKAYYVSPQRYQGHDGVEPQVDRHHAEKRICGIKRKLFFVALVVGILIILGAVLGGALGATLGKSTNRSTSAPSSNSTQPVAPGAANVPISAYQNGGTALIVPATSSGESRNMYLYYQDALGNIVESAYENGTMRAMSTETVVNITNAAQRSPIAATSWLLNGNIVRGIFYIDASDGSVMTTNTTGTQPWSVSTPYNILTGDTADRETMALAVHSGNADLNQGLSGIRVVYGSSSCGDISDVPCIREVGCDFFENSAQPVWHMWVAHNGSDVKSGVASVITNNVAHVYWRSADNDTLQQWTWDYFKQYQNQPNAGWNLGECIREPRCSDGADGVQVLPIRACQAGPALRSREMMAKTSITSSSSRRTGHSCERCSTVRRLPILSRWKLRRLARSLARLMRTAVLRWSTKRATTHRSTMTG